MKSRSIRNWLPLSYAAVALLATVVLGAVLLTLLRVYYQQREYDALVRNANFISATVTQAFTDKISEEALISQVKSFASLTQTRVRILGPDGKLMADSGPWEPLYVDLFVRKKAPSSADPTKEFPQRKIYFVFREPNLTTAEREQLAAQAASDSAGSAVFIDPASGSAGSQTSENVMLYEFNMNNRNIELGLEIQRSNQSVMVPLVSNDGTSLGMLELSGGPDYGGGIVAGVALAWILAGGVGVLLAAVVGWFISRRMIHPLLQLTAVTSRMAAGDLSARADSTPKDEIGDLGRSFNEMASQVETLVFTLRRFVADAAHELNTPLTVLRNNLDLAVEETDHEEMLALARDSRLQVGRLEELAHDLLDLSRLESGTEKAALTPVDLADLVRQASEVFASQAEQAGLRYEMALPAYETLVLSNETQLQRAIGNLVENAIKFTPEGGTVKIEVIQEDGQVRVQVMDTGIGIPEADLPHLFSRFHRGGNANSYPGNGLGLAIVRTIVNQQGGTVVAQNRETGGACFSIRLPLFAPSSDRFAARQARS